jgi:DNA-binding CsgD family transcriptional regulator
VDGPRHTGLDPRGVSENGAHAARIALIERDEAWKLGSHAIGLARGGAGSALLFEGASGLGKSGLITAIGALAEESGLRVMTAVGRCSETNFPFGVMFQLFESELKRPEDLETFAPRLHDAIGSEASLSVIPRIYRVCAEFAETSPLALSIDDADLADEQSLRFLLYLIERLSDLPIAIFLTAGTVAPRRAPAGLAEIARHPSTTRLRLEPLSPLGTTRRVTKTTFSAAAQEAAKEIHLASGGIPFIVDSLARTLGQAEESGGEELSVTVARGLASPGVAEWALVRAGNLHPAAPRLLKAVAVLGPDCELRHACALAGLDPEALGDTVDDLTEVGILALGERLSFAQPAVAAEIERAQTPSERAASNLRAGRLLAEDGEPPERVADHLLLAPRMGSAWTVDALSMAAAVALGRANPFDAVRYLRRALDEPPPRVLRAHVVLELGRAEAMAGEPQAAGHLADGLAQLTDPPPDPSDTLVAGRTLFALRRPHDALSALERGLATAPELDPEFASRLEAAYSTALWLTGFSNGCRPALGVPPASADTAGDRTLLGLHAIEGALRGAPASQVRALAERALARGALLDDETSDGLTYYLVAAALAFAGDLQMAEVALTAAVHDAQARGSVLGFATASHVRARTILKRGRLIDAALDARYALAVERDSWPRGVGDARVVLAHTLMERGDLEGAKRHLDIAEAAMSEADPSQISLRYARGRLTLSEGDARSALNAFLACGTLAERAGIVNPAVVGWRADAGLAMAMLGDWSEAERLIESEIALANDFGEPGTIGRALRALGSVRDAEGALEAFRASVASLQDSQAALELATTLVEFGAALRRSGRRRDARTQLKAGLDLAERCDAQVLAARALREAKVAGARPRRTALHGYEALTTRERQVSSLAAGGLSNREIAEKLFVTVKTVEWHLKHCYVKLGVSSRTELRGKLGDAEPIGEAESVVD